MTRSKDFKDKQLLLELLKEKNKREAKSKFIPFIKSIMPNYEFNWHHVDIANKLQEFLLDPKKNKLMIFVPPQHGKSQLSSRLFPSWALGINPDNKIVISSYSADLSSSFNRDVQRLVDNKVYREIFPNTKINSKNIVTTQSYLRNSEIFEIIDRDGFLKTVGVGGSLVGRPIDLGIIDDPIKDHKEASSSTIRERIWQWYLTVFSSRLHNGSKQLILMTRWHDDDLCGRLLNPKMNPNWEEWEVIKYPAIKTNDDNLFDPREIGDALWESKHSKKRLLEVKSISNSVFESLYQQNPIQEGGNIIKKHWFNYRANPPFGEKALWIDGAYTKKKKNDPTGILETLYDGNKLFFTNAELVRLEMPELLNYLNNYKIKRGLVGCPIYIEPKANGLSIQQMLSKYQKGNKLPIISISNQLVNDGKETRAHYLANHIEAGNCETIQGSWNNDFEYQLTGYPSVKHDEFIDLGAYACWNYFENNLNDIISGAVSYKNLI